MAEKSKDVDVFDLTLPEIADLLERRNKRAGIRRLLSELSGMLGEQVIAEGAWWAAIQKRLGLEDVTGLIANGEVGKVWRLGKVPELAALEQRLRSSTE